MKTIFILGIGAIAAILSTACRTCIDPTAQPFESNCECECKEEWIVMEEPDRGNLTLQSSSPLGVPAKESAIPYCSHCGCYIR